MKKPILLRGPMGSGKTFLANKIMKARGKGVCIESICFLLGEKTMSSLIQEDKPEGWFSVSNVKTVIVEDFKFKHADIYLTLFREFPDVLFIVTTLETKKDAVALHDTFEVIDCTHHLKGGNS